MKRLELFASILFAIIMMIYFLSCNLFDNGQIEGTNVSVYCFLVTLFDENKYVVFVV